jgi:hypothetical protein
MTITVADLVAIDVHVHVEVDDEGHTALPQSFLDSRRSTRPWRVSPSGCPTA